MASLLRVHRICPAVMDLFTQAIRIDVNEGASYKTLAQIVHHGKPLLGASADQPVYEDVMITKSEAPADTIFFTNSSSLVSFRMTGISSPLGTSNTGSIHLYLNCIVYTCSVQFACHLLLSIHGCMACNAWLMFAYMPFATALQCSMSLDAKL